MPRHVRNFWVELEVDGVKRKVASGPRAKDGGFRLVVFMRKDGMVTGMGEVRGFVNGYGELVLQSGLPTHEVAER